MPKPPVSRRSGFFFIAGGCAFLVAALLARQPAFTGVGFAFLGIGASWVAKARRSGQR